MQLDRNKLPFKIDAADSCFPAQVLQLFALAHIQFCPEMGVRTFF
jgi:hypothetical protein